MSSSPALDELERDSLRDLAVSIRDQEGVHAVALAGALAGGSGVALVSAVTPDSPLNAGALIDDAKKTVGGGGNRPTTLRSQAASMWSRSTPHSIRSGRPLGSLDAGPRLDLGQKRVGVAVSDSAGALAMPIEVLSRVG